MDTIKIFPCDENNITSCKKRTYMQPQFNKSDKVFADGKDQFFTTADFANSYVWTIDMQKASKKVNLPTENHPFDHFLVVC